MDLEFLKTHLSFFSALSDEDQREVAFSSYIQKCKKGDIIVDSSIGYTCTSLILVINGRLKSMITNNGKDSLRLYYLFVGDFCVLSAAETLYGIKIDLRIVSDSDDTTILKLPIHTFIEIKQRNRVLNEFMRRQFIDRYTDVLYLLEERLESSSTKIVANYLLEKQSQNDLNTIKLKHEDIATDLALSRSSVSTILKRLEEDALIEIGYGYITILDLKRLVYIN